MMVCTEPLPNERVPISVARLWSCKAPATISDAEAEPPLISTMTGLPLVEVARLGVEALGFFGIAAAGRDDLAALEEGVGHRDGLLEQAAGIVAQVEDVALDLVAPICGGRGCRSSRFRPSVVCSLKVRDADIADVVAFDARAHRADADVVAGQRDLDRLVQALAHDLQLDLGVDRAAHLLDGLVQGQALHLASSSSLVMMSLARMPALDGGRVVDRRDDLDQAVFHGDFDAEAAELAARLHLHVAEALGIHVARMRIEAGQHAVDGGLDQLAVVRLLDIVGCGPARTRRRTG